MSEPKITRLEPGESGIDEEDGRLIGRPRPKKAQNGQRPLPPERRGEKLSPTQRAKLSDEEKMERARESSRKWYQNNRARGAARATRTKPDAGPTPGRRTGKPAARIAMTVAPHYAPGFSPSPNRFARYSAALEELRKERDGLTVIITHLERLVGDPT